MIYSDHLQCDNTEQALQLLPPNAHHSQRPNFQGGDSALGNQLPLRNSCFWVGLSPGLSRFGNA